MPKVSVIIPVYNTEKYLVKCLESVCQQTLKDIEIICVNDCSPDNSLQILQEYAEKDSRIKIIDFNENKGVSAARNAGIQEARGEFLGFVDSDDFIDLNFYEKLYQKAAESGADVVKGNIYDCDENGLHPELTIFYNRNKKIRKNKAYFCYGFTSAIYKREFITIHNIQFPVDVTHFEDPYFSIWVSIYLKKIDFVDSAKYYYIRHENSACMNYYTKRAAEDFFSVVKKIFEILNNLDLSEEDYCIYVSFLLVHIIFWCETLKVPEVGNMMAAEILAYVFKNCTVSLEKILMQYFLEKREERNEANKKSAKSMINKLREKHQRENNG